jgi:hypothetical protein
MRFLIIPLLCLLTNVVEVQAQCVSGDCRNGRGIYVYPSGAKYIGDFKDGEIHGIGVCYYTDGSKYQGEWRHRFPHGKGTKTYADGHQQTGKWHRGRPVDDAGNLLEEYVVQASDERDIAIDIQSGCIDGDCKDGQGTFAYPDGSKYDGQFRLGKLQGLGTWYFVNGDRYVGAFANNFPHGKGTLYKTDGSVIKGLWKEGEYAGSDDPAALRTGCISGNCVDGEGTYVFKNATATYRGEFENESPHGYGVLTYANGDRYEGEWEKGEFHGEGLLTRRDGTLISGRWEHGRYLVPAELEAEMLAQLSPPTRPAPDDRRAFTAPRKVWAVIVGVGAYTNMPALRYTDDDAYRFYAFLKSVDGGGLRDEQVRILIDEEATRKRILETAKDLFGKAHTDDLILFYFSGHGLKGGFLPYDFDGYYNKIYYEELAALLEQSNAAYKICFADACHSGGLFAEDPSQVSEELARYYEDLYRRSTGTAIIMSSKAEETSLESAGLRQGVFSHFLIRGLKGEADADGDGIVTIEELFNYIYVNVRAYTGMQQSPLIRGDFDPRMPVAIVPGRG